MCDLREREGGGKERGEKEGIEGQKGRKTEKMEGLMKSKTLSEKILIMTFDFHTQL